MAGLMPLPKMRFTNHGRPLVGGQVHFFEAGTSARKDTYKSLDQESKNTNPVILDVNGEADIWLGSGAYKIVLKTILGSVIWSVDNIFSAYFSKSIHYEFGGSVADQIDRLMIGSISAGLPKGQFPGQKLIATSYYDGWAALAAPEGGGEFVWLATSTLPADGFMTFAVPGVTTGRWRRILGGQQVFVEMAGVRGDGETNDTARVQAVIDYLYELNQGTGGIALFRSGKTYRVSGLIWKPGITLACESWRGSYTETNVTRNNARLQQVNPAAEPMIMNDPSIGVVRNNSSLDGRPQRWFNGVIAGLCLNGSNTNTTTDCDLLRLERAWGGKILDCNFRTARGFGLRMLDCNEWELTGNGGTGACWYLESIADCIIDKTQLGGGNGTMRCPVWVSGGNENAWKNQFPCNVIFNNMPGAGAEISSIDTGTDEITFTAPHGWTDQLPIMIETTNTLPGGLSAAATYYVKVTAADKVKLSTRRIDVENDVFVNITSAGTGVHTAYVGPNANVGLTSGASRNVFGSLRSDQGYGDGVLLNGAPANSFGMLDIAECGLGNPVGISGLHIINGSTRTSVGGGTIDGTKFTISGADTRQKYGVRVDPSSRPGLAISPALIVHDHRPSQSEAGADNFSPAEINPNQIMLGSDRFEVNSGSPVIGAIAGGRRNAWLFDSSADEIIGTELAIPPGWTRVRIELGWVNAGAGSGDVVWGLNIGKFSPGESLNASDQINRNLTGTAGAQDVLVVTTQFDQDITTPTGSGFAFLRVRRSGTDVADTLGNDAGLVYVRIYKDNS